MQHGVGRCVMIGSQVQHICKIQGIAQATTLIVPSWITICIMVLTNGDQFPTSANVLMVNIVSGKQIVMLCAVLYRMQHSRRLKFAARAHRTNLCHTFKRPGMMSQLSA